ncbi:membrane protein [Rugosimonospora africana]|uniref:Membrane protein n=1 Tax=Rugosimonospora africana TaxID=556532 RepID=A0A8J3R1R3_9ACTN|nr:membrane protein [Rugosimonospora africana]
MFISALLTAFAWPAVHSSVHNVPIAVSGPAPAAAHVTAALEQRLPGAFQVTLLPNAAMDQKEVLDRQVYGAIDVSSGTPQVITASAASPAIAQVLQGVGNALEPSPGGVPTVRDIAALPVHDPRGAGLAAGFLPLVIGGTLTAVLLTNRVRRTDRRIAGAFGFAAAGGLAMTAILQFWLGSLTGDYWANAGVVALSVASTSMTLLGLESVLGVAGLGLGAIVMVLIGNPLAGTASAPEMLPGWSGALGQLLPPGAAGTLLRSTAFFDGHGAARPVAVLFAWLALGAVLSASGLHARRRTPGADPAAPVTTTATA